MSAGAPRPPRPTRLGRLGDYLGEMYPLAVHVPLAVANVSTLSFGLQAAAGRAPLPLTPKAGVAVATLVLLGLLLRIYDEQKDLETDLRLGRAGDPRYKDRAIVTGRVTPADLAWLRGATTALVLLVNLPLGPSPALGAFAFAFALAWASSRWFFWPRIAGDLRLAFLTHNPLALAFGVYVVTLTTTDLGLLPAPSVVVRLLLGLWLPISAWEIARKTRCPADETAYETYSKRLGYRAAGALPAAFVVGGLGCTLSLVRELHLGVPVAGVLSLGAAGVVAACARFLLRPSTRSAAALRPMAELYTLLATVSLAFALAAHHGVRLR